MLRGAEVSGISRLRGTVAGAVPGLLAFVIGAGFFAIVCLGAAVLSAWGLIRGTASRDASDGDS